MHVISDLFLVSLAQPDRSLNVPLYRQIYDALRLAILDGRLPRGAKLPSSRDMAALLQVSRNTILNAVDQLIAEDYLEARVGAGIFVTGELPDQVVLAETAPGGATASQSGVALLSAQGREWVRGFNPAWYPVNQTSHNLFRNGLPAISRFPFRVWHKLAGKYLLDQPEIIFDFYSDQAGYPPLRTALAQYLSVARAVNCRPENVMIWTGVEQLVYLAAKLLLNPGDKVWVEEPGFPGAARALEAAGAQIVPVPVDDKGLDVSYGLEMAPEARLVYVTPSHQFPVGSTLSLERRLQLLNWSAHSGAWILEDDYDSEYCYDRRPLASLQGLDVNNRVIYMGSFTKVLFPGIRLDYAVLPAVLVKPFTMARATLDIHLPTLNQAILADFIFEGHFSRHIRRMRKHYGALRQTLLAAIRSDEAGLLTPVPANGGMHICAWLPPGLDDEVVCARAAAAGIEVFPVSQLYVTQDVKHGLVLGYTAAKAAQIPHGVERLLQVIGELVAIA